MPSLGSLATEPAERAKILRHAWGPITDGNVADHAAATRAFMSKYAAHIPRVPEFVVEDITVESFKATCQKARKSAAALDGWTVADLPILSDKAYSIIVNFLNAIEHGTVQWPEEMQHTRTVFLSKDPDCTEDPLAYRGLKITSAIYRRWASNRLKALRRWIAQGLTSLDCTMGPFCPPRRGGQRCSRCLDCIQPQGRA